ARFLLNHGNVQPLQIPFVLLPGTFSAPIIFLLHHIFHSGNELPDQFVFYIPPVLYIPDKEQGSVSYDNSGMPFPFPVPLEDFSNKCEYRKCDGSNPTYLLQQLRLDTVQNNVSYLFSSLEPSSLVDTFHQL